MVRRALVTGAGSGIGLATTLRLAAAGWQVAGIVPDAAEGERLAHELAAREGLAGSVQVVVCDLGDAAARHRAVAPLEVEALVNNAGYMNAGFLGDVPIDEARRQLEVMVLAPVDLALLLLPRMLERGEGRIVNVTSSAAHASTPLTGWYQASKAALRELNDSLREELAPTPIDVVDVEPGGIATRIWPRARRELERRRSASRWPRRYDLPIRVAGGADRLMADPDVVAARVERALSSRRPRRHYRVGPGARLLRATTDIVPDALWDRLGGAGSGRI